MGHDPDRDLTLIVLTNLQSTPDGDGSANKLAKLIIAEFYPTPAPPTSPSPLAPKPEAHPGADSTAGAVPSSAAITLRAATLAMAAVY